jgi:hypothetical protein
MPHVPMYGSLYVVNVGSGGLKIPMSHISIYRLVICKVPCLAGWISNRNGIVIGIGVSIYSVWRVLSSKTVYHHNFAI